MHKLLLTKRQNGNLCKISANNSSANIKLSKPQTSKRIQSGGFIDRLRGTLLRTGFPSMENVLQPLAKSVLIL